MNQKIKILQLEDEINVVEIVNRLLVSDGFDPEIIHVNTRDQYLDALAISDINLIIADYSLPDFDGLTALNLLRKKDKTIPFILFSGSIGEEKAIESLRQGATDYVLKQNINALVPAVKRAFHESQIEKQKNEAEQALHERDALFHSMTETANDAILGIDDEARIFAWNTAACTMFGYSAGEAIGKNAYNLLLPKKYAARMEKGFKQFSKTGEGEIIGKTVVISAKRKNGSEFPAELSVSKLRKGDKWYASGRICDITERINSQKIQQAIFRIASVSAQITDPVHLYSTIHNELKNLIDTSNFFIGLYKKKTDTIMFPYMVDQDDELFNEVPAANTISAWVIKEKKPLLLRNENEEREFVKKYCNRRVGTPAKCWLGVPLSVAGEAIGIIVVQSHKLENAYSEKDMELLQFVADQVSTFIGREQKNVEIHKLSRAIEQSPSVVMVTDSNGVIEYVNPAFVYATGYTAEEATGKKTSILKSGKHTEEFYKNLWNTIKAGNTWHGEFLNKKKNDDFFWEESVISPIKDDAGNISHFVAIKSDITKRKETENALAKEKNLLDTLLNSMPDHIYFKDKKSRFLRVNQEMAKYFGLNSPDELINKTDFDFFTDDHALPAFEDEQIVMKTNKPIRKEEMNILHDGRKNWISTIKVPMKNTNGKIVGTMGISRDISGLKKAEQELIIAHHETDQILTSLASILIVTDENEKIIRVNKYASKIFGFNENTVAGKNILDSGINWDWQKIVTAIEKCRTKMETVILHDVSFETCNQKQGFLNLSISPFLGSNATYPGYLIVGMDSTERNLLESQLTQAQKLESIGQLAAGIAHEINTPIQFVGDNTQFLKDAFEDFRSLIDSFTDLKCRIVNKENIDDKINEIDELINEIDLDYLLDEIPIAINQSLDGVSRVSKIVRAMKEFSHPGVKEKIAIDINQSIRNTVTVSRNEWKYFAELEEDFDPDLPQVPCIPDELNQVILNLIINSAHAIADKLKNTNDEKGLIKISTRQLGENIEIRIKDSGSGIPDEIKKRVFDPFFTTKEVGKGTGQGLAISHAVITQKHNGTITFESEKGKGTTFIISLPLKI